MRALLHRRTWRLAGAAVLLVTGLGTAGVAWGRPHLSWRFQPFDNHLVVTLGPGGGPFASWLLPGSFTVDGRRAERELVTTLPAGRTSQVTAEVTSLWSTTLHIVLPVPPEPAVVSSTTTAGTVTLSFSMPVTTLTFPCGLLDAGFPMQSVSFTRGTAPCSGTLQVSASSGEGADVAVFVPALSSPPSVSPTGAASGPARVIFLGPKDAGAFYITVDDGTYPDPGVLALVQQQHVPVTAFLISPVAAEHLDYWRSFLAAGGDIEDHTVSHPNLAELSEAAAEAQWAGAAQAFHQWFGTTAVLGRPPYGDVDQKVEVAAGQAGLRYVVLWSASMYSGQLTTYDHGPLRAGEIVILHWIPGLYQSLVQLLNIAAGRGLHPASLRAALGE